MLRCAIFDLDETLANTLPLVLEAFHGSIGRLSEKKLTDQDFINTFGPSEEGTVMALVPDLFDEALAGYLDLYGRLHAKLCPEMVPGAKELLLELKERGILLAVVSGKGMKSLMLSLEAFGVADWFDHIEGGLRSGPSKPLKIKMTLDALRLAPEEVIYIGDAPSDIAAAREAGIGIASAAWCASANAEKLRSLQPDFVAESVEALSAWLKAQ